MFSKPCFTAALLLVASFVAQAADDKTMLQMASCDVSWLDFKDNPVKVQQYFGPLETQYRRTSDDGSFEPLMATSLLGQKISRIYPQSVGMGLGYSVIMDAGFDAAKAAVEKQLGKKFSHCAEQDGAKSCELPIADKKTVMLMEGSRGKNPQTLFGCYYYYYYYEK